ncbi:hypothetical protein BaRGS_00005636 [Batillaria attramentaria]|uniref:Uncharacterized protein n=1 Tax=Batillaria attramentaria TaxID=370345 RepID=A0ABD0LUU6_9CAEN
MHDAVVTSLITRSATLSTTLFHQRTQATRIDFSFYTSLFSACPTTEWNSSPGKPVEIAVLASFGAAKFTSDVQVLISSTCWVCVRGGYGIMC